MKTILLVLWRVAAVGTLLLLVAPFAWEKATGDYFMTVTGTSMKPTYDLGDVLVVQPARGDELTHVGDPVIATFTPGDKETQYVHRVTELTGDGAILQGDNNDTPDPAPITQNHVMGSPRVALTGWLAKSYHVTQHPVLRIAAAVLFLPALFIKRTRPANPSGPRRPSGRNQDTPATGESTIPSVDQPGARTELGWLGEQSRQGSANDPEAAAQPTPRLAGPQTARA